MNLGMTFAVTEVNNFIEYITGACECAAATLHFCTWLLLQSVGEVRRDQKKKKLI